MNQLKEIIGCSIKDIVLTGLVDTDESPLEFIPLMDFIYIKIDNRMLEIRLDNPDASLQVSFVEKMEFRTDLEDSHLACTSSVGMYALADQEARNLISYISLYNPAIADNSLSCKALEFGLDNNQILFFDPMFITGINFGGEEQKRVWAENINEFSCIRLN